MKLGKLIFQYFVGLSFGNSLNHNFLVSKKVNVSTACWAKNKSYPDQCEMNSEDFEEINENPHVGCGFIPKWKLKELFWSSPVTAVQVRIFAPKLEILQRNVDRKNGIDKIQLSTSMNKVQKVRNRRMRIGHISS